jgi:hypothetical protein
MVNNTTSTTYTEERYHTIYSNNLLVWFKLNYLGNRVFRKKYITQDVINNTAWLHNYDVLGPKNAGQVYTYIKSTNRYNELKDEFDAQI